jgi:hypothetical protein
MDSLPAIIFPLHDPDGAMLDHLARITPDLKALFSRAVVSVTPPTVSAHEDRVQTLAMDPFFELASNPPGSQVGDHFLNGFRRAVELCEPSRQLHLCTLDRLAYALQSEHRESFMSDMAQVAQEPRPVLFQRSPRAWDTHPRTYHAIEAMITRAGEVLFGSTLDYAWCHLAIRAGRLARLLQQVEGIPDYTFMTLMVMLLREEIITRDVDWLAWEDPFMLGRDPAELKATQEDNPADWEKLLGYAQAMVRVLLAHAAGQGGR